MEIIPSPIFFPGYVVGVAGRWPLGWLAEHLFSPRTNLYHFFIIADYIPEVDDYTILESISKGVTVGRLSWYAKKDYDVFAVVHPHSLSLGIRVCRLASNFGRHHYDYLLVAKLLAGVVYCFGKQLLCEHTIRRIKPHELPYAKNSAFICTELANAVWRQVGFPLVPYGVVPLPASIDQAVVEGRLILIYRHIGAGALNDNR